jgi:hypothetical protein
MARKVLTLAAIGAAIAAAALSIAPAQAEYYGGGYQQVGHNGDRGWQGERGSRGGQDYYGGHYRHGGRGNYGNQRNRYRCDRGTGGTIIGAIAGGLLGNSIAGYGDRTAGAVIGAGAGALAGRAIDRDC